MLRRPTQRLSRLSRYLMQLHGATTDHLLAVATDKARFHTLYRLAALRWLISKSPLSVTRGAPYAQRRRAVRLHYKI